MLRFLSHGAWRSRSKHRGLHAYPKSTMKLCWTVQVKSRLGWLYSLADLTSSSALRRDFTTSKPEEGPRGSTTYERHSQRHALTLQLLHPRTDATVGLVALVVLVTRKAEELASTLALGLTVLVVRGGHITDHLGARGLERLVQLLDAIAEVVTIALRVTATEDCHGLAAQAQALDVIENVVPSGARAVLVCTGVPSGASHNETVVLCKVLSAVFPDVGALKSSRLGNFPCNRLSVTGLGGKEEPHSPPCTLR